MLWQLEAEDSAQEMGKLKHKQEAPKLGLRDSSLFSS